MAIWDNIFNRGRDGLAVENESVTMLKGIYINETANGYLYRDNFHRSTDSPSTAVRNERNLIWKCLRICSKSDFSRDPVLVFQ